MAMESKVLRTIVHRR